MKPTPMFLMLLLATALSEAKTEPARGATVKPRADLSGAQTGREDSGTALEIAHLAAARRIKPAA